MLPLNGRHVEDPAGWTADDAMRAETHNRGFKTDRYVRGAVQGRGGFGTVYKVLRVGDGRVFAGKACGAQHEIIKEAKMLRSLHHVGRPAASPPPLQKGG